METHTIGKSSLDEIKGKPYVLPKRRDDACQTVKREKRGKNLVKKHGNGCQRVKREKNLVKKHGNASQSRIKEKVPNRY